MTKLYPNKELGLEMTVWRIWNEYKRCWAGEKEMVQGRERRGRRQRSSLGQENKALENKGLRQSCSNTEPQTTLLASHSERCQRGTARVQIRLM